MPTATLVPQPLPPPKIPMFLADGKTLTPQWYIWFESQDTTVRALRLEVSALIP